MKSAKLGVWAIVLSLSVISASAYGWALPSLNPFASKPKTNGQVLGGKLVNGNAKSKPGVLSSITSAPKKAWNKTKSLLTPGKKPSARKTTGLQSSRDFHPVEEKKDSWFESLASKEENAPAKSVGEWMRLKQVKPGLPQ